jgi:hypothetical protein
MLPFFALDNVRVKPVFHAAAAMLIGVFGVFGVTGVCAWSFEVDGEEGGDLA